ncbi:MAG: transposase, partial [Ruminococcus sp.]|nr:transposase [Ruminococcus sp.]
CADVYEISLENGANINQWEYWGGDGQKFILEPALAEEQIVTTTTTTTTTTTATTTTTTTTTTAPVKPEATVWGDANCDGSVKMDDVIKVMMYSTNKEKNPLTEQGLVNADVYQNGDGVDVSDALSIQKKITQAIDTLPES